MNGTEAWAPVSSRDATGAWQGALSSALAAVEPVAALDRALRTPTGDPADAASGGARYRFAVPGGDDPIRSAFDSAVTNAALVTTSMRVNVIANVKNGLVGAVKQLTSGS